MFKNKKAHTLLIVDKMLDLHQINTQILQITILNALLMLFR
jgi:hypothetical protein